MDTDGYSEDDRGQVVARIKAGLLLTLILIAASPADRLTWPIIQWRVYGSPSDPAEWEESPVLIVRPPIGRVDTVFAAELFTPVELRLSERCLRRAFGVSSTDPALYRSAIRQRLDLASGTEVDGYLFRWRINANSRVLLERTRPTAKSYLGNFQVE